MNKRMPNYVVKASRMGHFLMLVATLFFLSIVYWAYFLKEDPVPFEGSGIIIFLIIGGISAVLVFMSVRMLILLPNVLTMNADGFEYNPGGVSSGWIPWSNVAELKETQVRTQQGQLNGPVWESVMAIKLKDPQPYQDQFNILIRGLMQLNDQMYDADIFFRLSSFGRQLEEVRTLMYQYWHESQKSKPISFT